MHIVIIYIKFTKKMFIIQMVSFSLTKILLLKLSFIFRKWIIDSFSWALILNIEI